MIEAELEVEELVETNDEEEKGMMLATKVEELLRLVDDEVEFEELIKIVGGVDVGIEWLDNVDVVEDADEVCFDSTEELGAAVVFTGETGIAEVCEGELTSIIEYLMLVTVEPLGVMVITNVSVVFGLSIVFVVTT